MTGERYWVIGFRNTDSSPLLPGDQSVTGPDEQHHVFIHVCTQNSLA